jgi:hypothetical protein
MGISSLSSGQIALINLSATVLQVIVTCGYVFLTWKIVRATESSMQATQRSVNNMKEAHLSPVAEVERMIANVPSALAFHGITSEDLAACEVTAEEFAYVVASFTVGGIYHRTMNPDLRGPFPPDTYRYHMCCARKTQDVWHLLKRMLNPGPYRDRIEKTIEHNRTNQGAYPP